MKRFMSMLALLSALMMALPGCVSSPAPYPHRPLPGRLIKSDDALMAALREDWRSLHLVRMDDEPRRQLINSYNQKVLLLLRRLRHDALRRGKSVPYDVVIDGFRGGTPVKLERFYDDIVAARDIPMRDLEERYISPGLGIAAVGIVPASKLRKSDRIAAFHARGAVRTLTLLVEFRGAGEQTRPVLRLIPRQETERVQVGRLSYPLAGDFSAPIEMYWRLTQVDKNSLLGLLRPQRGVNCMGITCIERYDPDKIPVVLVHGLASSAATFSNLVNRLQSDPTIRRNYQFWYFNYPTGTAWTISAASYRKALREARERFDPERTNKNWDQMIVVGHSMGGLITRYSQCVEPWKMLTSLADNRHPFLKFFSRNPSSLSSPALRELKDVFYFQPVKASAVVYMATPHRGAPIARNRLALLLSNMVRLPETIVEEAFNITTLQRDNLIVQPHRLTEWFTSIRQLSPDSDSIRALSSLPVRNVPTYSIIGDRGYRPSTHGSDGIVPYWSSHLPWGSECIIPSDHSVQDTREAADEMKRILLAPLQAPSSTKKAS